FSGLWGANPRISHRARRKKRPAMVLCRSPLARLLGGTHQRHHKQWAQPDCADHSDPNSCYLTPDEFASRINPFLRPPYDKERSCTVVSAGRVDRRVCSSADACGGSTSSADLCALDCFSRLDVRRDRHRLHLLVNQRPRQIADRELSVRATTDK